mmetsp:Transcript_11791/g.27690  ORF Transcript_11791/g.27690 Transcript_11791/m.27690 type:complete len:130 (-) Transcript_11791:54-443(-)
MAERTFSCGGGQYLRAADGPVDSAAKDGFSSAVAVVIVGVEQRADAAGFVVDDQVPVPRPELSSSMELVPSRRQEKRQPKRCDSVNSSNVDFYRMPRKKVAKCCQGAAKFEVYESSESNSLQSNQTLYE